MLLKKIIWNLDSILFSGFFFRFNARLRENKSINFQGDELNHGFSVQYKKSPASILNKLCDTYGSDKGEATLGNNPYDWQSHNYADFYRLIFGLRRNDIRLVVECGLGTNNPTLNSSMGVNGRPGASLRVWRDFFQNAKIIGCDIDRTTLFTEDRIDTFFCDQTSPESINAFLSSSKLHSESADIIIDDGLHEFFAGKCFFEHMISTLRPEGIYIIEDVTTPDIKLYKDYFLKLDTLVEVGFVYFKSPLRNRGDDNNLIWVTKIQK